MNKNNAVKIKAPKVNKYKISLRSWLIFFIVMVIIAPPVSLYVMSKIDPPVALYELSYDEILSDYSAANDVPPISFVYCFEVPGNLKLDNDLQDFFVTLTGDDLKGIMLSETTGIDNFNYTTREGCGEYAVKIEKEDVRAAYELYKNGEL